MGCRKPTGFDHVVTVTKGRPAWRLHPTGRGRTTPPVVAAISNARRPTPVCSPRGGRESSTGPTAIAGITAGRRTIIGPRASRGGRRSVRQLRFYGWAGLKGDVRRRRSVPDLTPPAVFSIRVPRRRRDVPKSRVLAAALMAALVTGVAVPGGADDLADRQEPSEEAAGGAGRRHPGARPDRDGAELRRAAAPGRQQPPRLRARRLRAPGGPSAATSPPLLYKAGGTRPLSGILGSSADVVVSRVEFETILQEGQVEAVADAKVAFDSYEAAIKDVKAAMAQMARLEARSAKKTVAAEPRLREGRAGRRQAGRVQHHPPGQRPVRVLPGVHVLVRRLLGRRLLKAGPTRGPTS